MLFLSRTPALVKGLDIPCEHIDLFSFFSNGNLFNKSLGLKLRDTILSKGSSKDGLTLLRDFMGREPNVNAFTEWLKS